MNIAALKLPFDEKESFFIINEFQIEFPLSTVQPILNLLTIRKYTQVDENPTVRAIIKNAADFYEESRQGMLNEMVSKIMEKRAQLKPMSNLELLERMLDKTKTQCADFLSRRLTDRLNRKYFYMLLPPKRRRNKKKSQTQLSRKNTKKRSNQRLQREEIKKTRDDKRRRTATQQATNI